MTDLESLTVNCLDAVDADGFIQIAVSSVATAMVCLVAVMLVVAIIVHAAKENK